MAFMASDASRTATLTVYVESDGLAWLAPDLPLPDPTPVAPMAIELALAQLGTGVAYVARPCPATYWTEGRFAATVVAAVDEAISGLKERFGASRLQLVGYSGRAAAAALVAARRSDVAMLVTVTGNLDTDAWARLHRVPALANSFNAADESVHLENTADPLGRLK